MGEGFGVEGWIGGFGVVVDGFVWVWDWGRCCDAGAGGLGMGGCSGCVGGWGAVLDYGVDVV